MYFVVYTDKVVLFLCFNRVWVCVFRSIVFGVCFFRRFWSNPEDIMSIRRGL